MNPVRALMHHIIDYAGLFPPARLDMPVAVERFHSYLVSDDSWMLGRLIVPASRLGEFEHDARRLMPGDDSATPWFLSALVSAAEEPDAFKRDHDEIERFNSTHTDPDEGLAVIETIELRASSSRAIDAVIDLISDEFDAFFELPLSRDVRGMLAALAGTGHGAKVRTGGMSADLFPPAADLARFIRLCAAAEVSFKATAGLHHPFTHRSNSIPGATEFGFINVFFVAALLLHVDVDEAAAAAILADRNPESFAITDDGITYGEHRLTITEIEQARMAFARSYGSCSFQEPLDDLRNLNLLK